MKEGTKARLNKGSTKGLKRGDGRGGKRAYKRDWKEEGGKGNRVYGINMK